MTHNEVTSLLDIAERYNSTGNFVLAEQHARAILADSDAEQSAELKARAHLVISESLWRRGMAHEALPSAEEARRLAVESANTTNEAKALSAMGSIYQNFSDYAQALEYFTKALLLNEELTNKAGIAATLGNIGNVHRNLSDYPRALECYEKSLAINEELGNKKAGAGITNNIGNVYHGIGEHAQALQFYLKALAINEEIDNKTWIVMNLGNIGNVYNALLDYTSALEYFSKALTISEELGDKKTSSGIMNNIGNVYRNISDYPLAMQFYQKALAINEEINNKAWISVNLGNIGSIYTYQEFDGYNLAQAEEFLTKAIAVSEDIGYNDALTKQYLEMSLLCEGERRWEDAHNYYKKHVEIQHQINIEEVKKQESVRKQQKEIEIERIRATAERHLLNNILPKEISQRLIKGENPIADQFDSVSILFMDIADFTVLSSMISAQQLVYLLNSIFKAADAVMREYGLEKIKTIGDAYMAVAGAPLVQKDHAVRAAQASIALLSVMKNITIELPDEFGDRSWIESIPEIHVRIGLHCGPVAAGVVGENKFLYDLWGDTVNTASRMESHGEAGRVHVSETFVQTLSHSLDVFSSLEKEGIKAIERGEMDIKGKGRMRTYFLERA